MQTSTLYGGEGGHLGKLLFCLLINFHDCRFKIQGPKSKDIGPRAKVQSPRSKVDDRAFKVEGPKSKVEGRRT